MYQYLPSTVDSIVPSSAAPLAQQSDDAAVTPNTSSVKSDPIVQIPAQKPGVPPLDQINPKVVHREERVEYRDAEGNILNAEQVEALKGKVNFEVHSSVPTFRTAHH
jgi:dolichyl-phosphate-mannose-protein mannosyltransferase